MMPEERLMVLRKMCSTEDTPGFIVSRGLAIPEEMIQACAE